ncbi:hypothetical protein B5V89_12450 [Heyndrickxia sporothermodurans]|uniref:SA1320 family protein n=1 Tax=Heyndrickxia TaxID=2837504 RepID=UPI000D3C2AF6|nr:hypothetical protein [Heyndrickxia sporothermodurans]PTY77947.1 hypothetical protein B5V89_12450 [Heyndrickxia sporothermodurans]
MENTFIHLKQTPDQNLVQLSGFSIYKHPPRNSVVEVNKTEYKVLDTNYDTLPSGLDAAVVLDNTTGEISIIYEGTQPEKNNADVLTDASLVLSDKTADQFRDAHAYYKEMKKKYKHIDHVAGNSLGGGLANYVAVKEQVHSVTLDPAMLPADVAKEMKDYKHANITNYCGIYDPLTLAEMAGGYENRMPGKNIKINFGISWLKFFANNHTGYVSDEETNTIKEKITIGKKGTPSYGEIHFMADAYISTNIWTGDPLTDESVGTSQRIKINEESMAKLASAMETQVMASCKTADDYLQHSIRTVESEGSHLDDRKTNLQIQFDELLRSNPMLNQLLAFVKVESLGMSMLKKVSPAGGFMLDLFHSPFAEKITSILSSISRLQGCLVNLPLLIAQLGQAILDLEECITSITQKDIPLLFKGIDNHFLDGIVDELKAHYEKIDVNKATVLKQVSNFKTQTEEVKEMFEQLDTEIGNRIEDGKGGGLESVSTKITPSLQVICEPSPYLKAGMDIRREQLQYNFNRFSKNTIAQLDPILNQLGSITNQLINVLYDAQIIVKIMKFEASLIRIPFVSFDNRLREKISEMDQMVSTAIDTCEHVKVLIANIIDHLPDILQSFKPYIEIALFNGTQYEAVIIYNISALSILEQMKLQFREISYQLSENEAKTIQQLFQQASTIEGNMDVLIEQVKRGTL